MVLRALLALTLVAGCSPPPTCPRSLGGVFDPTSSIQVEGSDVVLHFSAPSRRCPYPADVLVATASFLGADGITRPVSVDGLTQDSERGVVTGALHFNAGPPGVASLRVGIEPTIALTTIAVTVATSGAKLSSTTSRIEGCPHPQRFSTPGLVLCQVASRRPDGGFDTTRLDAVLFADAGEVTRFSNVRDPQVVDDVMWLTRVDGGGATIERYVVSDGGLERTHASPELRLVTTRSYVQVDHALRLNHAFTVDGGALSVIDLSSFNAAQTFVDGTGVWLQRSFELDAGWCRPTGECVPREPGLSVLGMSAAGVWLQDPLVGVRAVRLARGPEPSVSLPLPLERLGRLEAAQASAGAWRPVSAGEATQPVLIYDFSLDAGPQVFAFFDRPVAQAGVYVAFLADGGGVRFVEFPR